VPSTGQAEDAGHWLVRWRHARPDAVVRGGPLVRRRRGSRMRAPPSTARNVVSQRRRRTGSTAAPSCARVRSSRRVC
jgi:hypothetical protein